MPIEAEHMNEAVSIRTTFFLFALLESQQNHDRIAIFAAQRNSEKGNIDHVRLIVAIKPMKTSAALLFFEDAVWFLESDDRS